MTTAQANPAERLANTKPLKIGNNEGWEGNRRSDTLVDRFLNAITSAGVAINSIEAGALAVAVAIDGGMLRWVLTVDENGKTKEGKAPMLAAPVEGSASVKIPAIGAFKGGYECVKDGKILRSRDGNPVAVAKVTPLTANENAAVKAAGITNDEAMLLKHLASHSMGGGIIAAANISLKAKASAEKKAAAATEKKAASPKAEKTKTKTAPKAPAKSVKTPPKPGKSVPKLPTKKAPVAEAAPVETPAK